MVLQDHTWYNELHSVCSKDMGDIFSIETRKYACFCEFCIDANGVGVDHCVNDAYVKQWKYVPLNPKGATSNSDVARDVH